MPAGPTPTATRAAVAPSATTAGTPPGSAAPTADPTVAAPAILVGAGDIATCTESGDEATADLLETLPGTVFLLGDDAYESGTAREFRDCYGPSWGRPSIKDRTRPVPGNHEYRTEGAAGYFGYFGAAAGDPDEGWYAFDAGAWRVYALNSNCAFIGGCETGSAQERWLSADLAANPRSCVAALWHHPRFSSGEEHGSDPIMRDLWRTLQDAGAELVLSGHDHLYERFAPQTAAGDLDPDRGLVQFVVGTGGRHLYEFGEIRPNSLVRNDESLGVIRLALSPGSYAFEFVPVAGETFTDSGTGACH